MGGRRDGLADLARVDALGQRRGDSVRCGARALGASCGGGPGEMMPVEQPQQEGRGLVVRDRVLPGLPALDAISNPLLQRRP
jgi:hypothetical protein